ncbi:MAG: ParB/RepB/Spo0J family partition protein [Deltaproteobacteria bacterium]|nr:MAG: ParB/RepB/Spo0J family partition protein [Deltaproteobacteria bacterium]UCH06216.1 MAG: ParB/RepB/Spo0J family partition protein [Deltaproteobacteria bacterium]
MAKRKALGRGFSALFPDTVIEEENRGLFYCPIESISPNPHQSRQSFGESELAELAQSIKEKGVIQPILVTKTKDGFQLIAGERRWRAAQKAGLDKIPALIRDVSPAEALQIALIENIQRQDLNPIEEAAAYQELLQEFNFTQEALSARIGKNRTTIANFLRLLKLPNDVQRDLIDGRLSAGHARVLVSIDSPSIQRKIRDLVIKRSLSVRQTEALVKRFLTSKKPKAIRDEIDSYLESLVNNLQDSLGTKVAIERKGKKGRIIIEFYSDDELGRLVERLR